MGNGSEKDQIKELKNELKKYREEYKLYQRIQSVLMVKSGETRVKVAEYAGVHRNTVGEWVKNYDKNGLDGLKSDYSKCGAESRLNDDQLKELYHIICNSDKKYKIRDVKNLIYEKYDVEYTMKQVWVICRKKLDLGYEKPYLTHNAVFKDADEKLQE